MRHTKTKAVDDIVDRAGQLGEQAAENGDNGGSISLASLNLALDSIALGQCNE